MIDIISRTIKALPGISSVEALKLLGEVEHITLVVFPYELDAKIGGEAENKQTVFNRLVGWFKGNGYSCACTNEKIIVRFKGSEKTFRGTVETDVVVFPCCLSTKAVWGSCQFSCVWDINSKEAVHA